MTQRSAHVFLYGTLRAGAAAHHLLQGARPLGPATLAGTLHDVGGRYPALVLDGAAPVHGERWEIPVSLLPGLDRYEGVEAGLYRRVEVELGGEACWVYVAGPALRGTLGPHTVIPSGQWPR